MKIELYNNINFNNYNLKSTNKRILILPKNIYSTYSNNKQAYSLSFKATNVELISKMETA